MLKIKDNVDLEELEKYGFTYDEDWYYDFVPYNENEYSKDYSYLVVIAHNKEHYKKIGFDYVDLEKHFQQAIEKIYNLIQAGLVEKKDKTIILHCRDPRERRKYQIKKQSENVFDLIDWNEDLIRIKIACGSIMVDCKHAKSDFSDGFYDVEWITSIYKPNSKGDYIKVWEKKDD